MVEKKLFVVTADMPNWQKWLIAKEIAKTFINATCYLFGQLFIVSDTEIEPRLRKEIEYMTNHLLNHTGDKIRIMNPVTNVEKDLSQEKKDQFVSRCRIENIVP